MPDLGKTFDEISAYAKSQGLHVFHGVPLIGEEPQGVMLWDENDKNWRDFIEVGLAEGVKTLVASKNTVKVSTQERWALSRWPGQRTASFTCSARPSLGSRRSSKPEVAHGPIARFPAALLVFG